MPHILRECSWNIFRWYIFNRKKFTMHNKIWRWPLLLMNKKETLEDRLVLTGRKYGMEANIKSKVMKIFFNKISSLAYILWNNLVKCYIWSKALYGSETWTLGKREKIHLESFKMYLIRILKIKWTKMVKND